MIEEMQQDGDCQRCGGKGCIACDAREQEPVAWRHDMGEENGGWEYFEQASCNDCQPLYTHPLKREWVNLEPKDMPDGEDPMFDHPFFTAGMVWAANKLKEKNT